MYSYGIMFGLALIGLVAGTCGGMLGIGGSIVMIPAMTELLGPQQHLYQAAALAVNFFVAAPAAWQHWRAGAMDVRQVKLLVPIAGVSAVAGVLCSELPAFRGPGAVYLTALFGAFLLFVAAREWRALWRLRRGGRRTDEGDGERAGGGLPRWAAAMLVALPTGFVSGFLGVGGGVVAVPLLRKFLRVGVRSAIADSAAMIIALSLIGTTVKHIALVRHHPEHAWIDPAKLAVFLIPTAVIGGSIGGRLTHVLPIRTVRIAFSVLLVVAGLRLLSRAME